MSRVTTVSGREQGRGPYERDGLTEGLRVIGLLLLIPTLLSWPAFWATSFVFQPEPWFDWCAEANHRVLVTAAIVLSPAISVMLLTAAWRRDGSARHPGVIVLSAIIIVLNVSIGVLGVNDAYDRAAASSYSSCLTSVG